MNLPEILAFKDPADFCSRQVKMARLGNYLSIEEIGDPMNFSQMQQLRQQTDPSNIYAGLNSREGHTFANLGVSLSIVLSFLDEPCKEFLVVAYNPRYKVYGLISGYKDSRISLLEASIGELEEELIHFCPDGILRGSYEINRKMGDLP